MAVKGFERQNIIGLFRTKYDVRMAGSWANRLSLFNPASGDSSEEYGIFGGYAAMREWIGARQAQTVAKKSYTIRNKPYESSLVVKQRDLERDDSGLLEAYIGNYANGVVVNQWEDLLIDLINANGNCYDGKAFFSASHVWGDSGTQKNLVTASEVPALNVTTAATPTPTEMAAAILGLTGQILTFKDDKGRSVNGDAQKFIVAVGTVPLFTAAVQAVSSNLLTGLVDNPLSGLKQAGFTFEVKFLNQLTSASDKLFVFREDGELKPFLLQEEQGVQYQFLGEGTDFYFENKAYKLGVDASRGAGYGLWEHACCGTFS